jgi:fibronectin type 3 domain-containing protein
VTAVAGDARVVLSWEPVRDALSYDVYISQTQGGTATAVAVPVSGSPYEQTGLTNGSTYYFAVSAVVDSGKGDLSSEVSATPRISAPGDVSAQGGVAEVTVSWSSVAGADAYDVYWADEAGVGSGSARARTAASPFVHGQRDDGTTYYYAVTAVDGSSESVLSAEVSATTASLPEVPQNLGAIAGDAQVTLTWDAVAGAQSYNVYVAESAGGTASALPIPAASSPHVQEDLNNGTTYYIAVSAVTQVGEGYLSAEVSATPRISMPEGVDAQGGDGQVTVTWEPVPGADSYNVYWALQPSVTRTSDQVSGVTTPFVHTSLAPYTTHYYAVTAVDGPSESVLSAEVSATTSPRPRHILAAYDASEADQFGYSVALSGDLAIMGARYDDGSDDSLPDAGAAYVFERTGPDTWDSGTKLVALDAQTEDSFGWSAAIDGDYAIVSAATEDGGPDDPAIDAGAAYVFHRTGPNTWDSGVKLVAPDAQKTDWFGGSVALGGDYAIVGAWLEDGGAGNPAANAGAAYVFRRTGLNTWDAGIKLVAPDAQADDNFGWSVALSGDYAVVSAYREDGGDGGPTVDAGAAYLFHRTGVNAWDAGTKLVAPDAEADDWFGVSVALGDSDIIVGAPHEDGGDGGPVTDAGAAYIFQY